MNILKNLKARFCKTKEPTEVRSSNKETSEFSSHIEEVIKTALKGHEVGLVLYYNPESPDRYQSYLLRSKDYLVEVEISVFYLSSKKSDVIVLVNDKFVCGQTVDRITRETIANWSGIPSHKFIQRFAPTSGDKKLEEALKELDPRDTITQLSESHWVIKRRYESGPRKWMEVQIKPNTSEESIQEGKYSVIFNCGKNSRLFHRDQVLDAYYPYRTLNRALNKKVSQNTLF